MVLQQIYSIITTDQDVIDIMATRFLPMRLEQSPETILPAAVYQVITTDPVNSLDGDSNLDLLRIQIKAWADTYTEAQELGIAIRRALTEASSLQLVTEFVEDDEDEKTKSYAVVMQFSVWSEFALLEVDMPYTFEGDGVTTTFLFPTKFRGGTLQLFKNGVLAEKGVTYNELSDRTGVSFPVAPAGLPYIDKFAAFFE